MQGFFIFDAEWSFNELKKSNLLGVIVGCSLATLRSKLVTDVNATCLKN